MQLLSLLFIVFQVYIIDNSGNYEKVLLESHTNVLKPEFSKVCMAKFQQVRWF